MEDKIKLTQEGKQKLEEELHNLVHVIRPEVIEELKAARAQGDLSENADYDAARARQGEVEGQIKKLESMLANCVVIEVVKTELIHTGSTVTYEDLSNNKEYTFTIVGTVEADPFNGKLSESSPLAMALLNHSVGDEITVKATKPYQVKVLKTN